MNVRSALIALLVTVTALAVGVSASQAIPPGGPGGTNKAARVTLNATTVKQGGRLKLTGTKFPKSKTVTIKLDDYDILATFKSTKTGTFTGYVTVPKKVKVGKHWFRSLAPGPPTSVKTSFTVKKA